MSDQDEIGRPNYGAGQGRQFPSTRPVPPSMPDDGGGSMRIRAVVAAACVVYAWSWMFDIYRMPMWTTLVAVGVAVRLARKSRDTEASDKSLLLANASWLAGVFYFVYVVLAAGYEYFVQHDGFGAILDLLFFTP